MKEEIVNTMEPMVHSLAPVLATLSNEATDSHKEVKQGNYKHLSRRVHRPRIGVRNLRHDEEHERRSKSENYLTFALLLGSGRSVHFDMAPEGITHIGAMVVQDREVTVARRTVRLTDINAVGCHDSFDPDKLP